MQGVVVDLDALSKSIIRWADRWCSHRCISVEPERTAINSSSPLWEPAQCDSTPHTGPTEGSAGKYCEDVGNKLFRFLKWALLPVHTVPSLSLPPQEGTHRIPHVQNVPGVLSAINTPSKTISTSWRRHWKPMMKLAMWCWMLTENCLKLHLPVKGSERHD